MQCSTQLFDIRAGEGRFVTGLAAPQFLTQTALYIGAPGVEGLLLTRYGTDTLPIMYIAVGLTVPLTILPATAGDHRYNLAWGHGGQQIALVHDLDMVIVVTSYPYRLEHDDRAWRHEKECLKLVADFIAKLPAK